MAHSAVWAEKLRVVLVGVPVNVERAAATALDPWHIEVVAIPAGAAADIGPDVQQARALAAEQRASAVIWLAPAPQNTVLRLYDTHSGNILSRPLATSPPFSDAMAASLALSIKTMLRQSRLMPAAPQIMAANHGWPAPDMAIESRVRMRIPSPSGLEPRFGLALLWTPHFMGSSYAAAATLDMGLGMPIESDNFVGNFTDIAIGIETHRIVRFTRRIEANALLGASLHRTHMRGIGEGGAYEADIVRWNPSADAGLMVRLRLLSRLYISTLIGGSYFPRRQNYVLYSKVIIRSPRYVVETGIGLGVGMSW